MAMKLADFPTEHPVNRENVEAYKGRMLAEVRAYHLRELRKDAGLTQQQLADCIGVSSGKYPRSNTGTSTMPGSALYAGISKQSEVDSPLNT